MKPEQMVIALLVASIPAIASIIAAVVATRSANRARRAEADAIRLNEVEGRLASKKYELYEPILRGLGQMLLPGNAEKARPLVEKALPDFMNFVGVWGSDRALEAFSKYRVGSSASPPPEITLRLVSDFMLAAREDLRSGQTSATGLDILGMRINDLYAHPNYVDAFTLPFDELASKHSWTPPWNIKK